jgi:hypothetical protein
LQVAVIVAQNGMSSPAGYIGFVVGGILPLTVLKNLALCV